MRYDGVGEKQITLERIESNQTAGNVGAKESKSLIVKNEERGSELTDCMSGAGRVSINSDAPATQSIYCQWHVDENTSVRHEAGEATQAHHGGKVK